MQATKRAVSKATKRMSGEERKAQIVKVATDLFAKKGFKGTTTREIAKKAGISEAVIFRHFARKEDLYDAIIDFHCSDEQGESMLIAILKEKKGREVFSTLASILIEGHQKDPSFLRLFTYSAIEKHRLSEMFVRKRALELIEYLETRIRKLIREGVFRQTDPALAARAFMGMVIQYSIAQEIYGLKKYFTRPNEAAVSVFVDIFFEGMLRR